MKKLFSTHWKSSTQPRKQRKYKACAPLHTRHHFLSAHLSKPLRQTHKKRAIPLRAGDKIKVLRGQYSGKEGTIERVDIKKLVVYVTGIERVKRDGSKSLYPLVPSNLLITDLSLSDQERKKIFERAQVSSGSSKKEKQNQIKQQPLTKKLPSTI